MQVEARRRNDEPPPPPSQPRPGPDAIGRTPALFDVGARVGVNVLLKLFFVGRIGKWTVPGGHWRCNVGEDEEGVKEGFG